MQNAAVDPISVIEQLRLMLSDTEFALAVARARIAQLEAVPAEEPAPESPEG